MFHVKHSSVAGGTDPDHPGVLSTGQGPGALTPRLFALEPGDKLWLGPKITGRFTLDDAPDDADLVLVATGTGLAPYMSMLRSLLPGGTKRRIAVFLGARHSWDLGYQVELMTMARQNPSFTYQSIISRPAEEPVPWVGPVGYVQDLWQGDHLDHTWGSRPHPDFTRVFLCGNPAMIEDMVTILDDEGFREHSRKEPGHVFVERYW